MDSPIKVSGGSVHLEYDENNFRIVQVNRSGEHPNIGREHRKEARLTRVVLKGSFEKRSEGKEIEYLVSDPKGSVIEIWYEWTAS